MKDIINWFLKGFGVGAANVIPGVSGGTIALITGIFERLINSIKSFNLKSLKLLLKGKFKEFAEYTDLVFLVAVFGGALASVFSLALLLKWLFANYETYVWAFFFGLIFASVFYVGRTVSKINFSVILSFIIGTGIAAILTFLNPSTENTNFIYVFLCGIAGIVSMILPGLSGSFILLLMGNYELVMIESVNKLDFVILGPFVLGMAFGLPAFAHVLSWVYKKYRNQTIASLTGFILGSLMILWPWKQPVFKLDEFGDKILDNKANPIIVQWEKYIPHEINIEVLLVVAYILSGILVIWLVERIAGSKPENNTENTN